MRYRKRVTPHVGVWIETNNENYSCIHQVGHTSCRCVDWNFTKGVCQILEAVTPHVGVWIETHYVGIDLINKKGHTSCRCVDWNFELEEEVLRALPGHTSCRCVDWNNTKLRNRINLNGHTSCRCVDWNTKLINWSSPSLVTPHVGVWIETASRPNWLASDWLSHLM